MSIQQSDGNQFNILVVDDTPANLQLLCSLLRRRGYEVRAVTSGQLALNLIKTNPPELILLDICMPQIDGYQVCQQLKANAETSEIPVIFISALDELPDKVKAFEAGGVDYITKPFQIPEVVARVETHLTLRRLQRQLQMQNELLQREVRDRLAAEAALQTANQELQRLAHSDSLTHVANRRRFDEYLNQEWQRMVRESQPLGLILCDVDFFKTYNDTYGHQIGDECLCKVADAICNAAKRAIDLVARYGGEEFAVILPNTPKMGALQVAQEIQHRVRQLHMVHETSQVNPFVTLSLGISVMVPMIGKEPTELIAAADRALYKAKLEGRNRIVLEEDAESRRYSSFVM